MGISELLMISMTAIAAVIALIVLTLIVAAVIALIGARILTGKWPHQDETSRVVYDHFYH